MRFSTITVILSLSFFVAASPLPKPDNASSQKMNNLANGINKGLDESNKELQGINNLNSVDQNKPTKQQSAAAKAEVQDALDGAVSQRKKNQQLAGVAGNEKVGAGLTKVQNAQKKAQASVDKLNGGTDDSDTSADLKTTFDKGQSTNEANLGAATQSRRAARLRRAAMNVD